MSRPIGLLAIALAVAGSCASPKSLVQLDITGDQPFSNVTLRLDADGGVSRAIAGVTFDQTQEYRVGLYLPSAVKGDVTIRASVDDGTCILGEGFVTVPGVSPGQTANRLALLVMRKTGCVAPPVDAGVLGTGGTTGTGGQGAGGPGTGGQGTVGSGGNVGPGTGGNVGPGTGGTGVGTGGRIGSGGNVGPGTGGNVGPGTGGTGVGTGGTGTGGAGTGGGGPGGNCGFLIDDMEANSGRICEGNGRIGHWFTYIDAVTTSTITPPISQTMAAAPYPVSPPRGTSQYATRVLGRYSSYAGIGCLLNNAIIGQVPNTYDATSHTGIRFYAKGVGGMTVNVNTRATISTQYGGGCTAASCVGATYRIPTLPADTWTMFSVPFTSLTSGTAVFQKSELWSIAFQPNVIGSFDLWVDDLTFY